MPPANERMQLTWLLGAPIRAGLGSQPRRRAGRSRFTRHAADASRWAAPQKTKRIENSMEDKPKIRDLPGIQKTLQNARTLSHIKSALPFISPLLRLFSIDVEKMAESLKNVDELKRMTEELASLPDRFNDAFADRGWVAYEDLDVELAKSALELAESSDLAGGEALLVAYYSPPNVERLLNRFMGISAFRPRMRLAKLALVDYEAQRFHACIPVILALLDGLVNELHAKRRGFFADSTELEAWDSISAHSKGLGSLTQLLRKGRRKTTSEPIDIPYRNGILHGADLGYDNAMVAAKAWAALFSAREWASRAERDALGEPPEKPKATFSDIAAQLRENADSKKRLQEWTPRAITIGVDVPSNGNPGAYGEGTPERAVSEFLTYWATKNYGSMAQLLSATVGYDQRSAPARVREIYGTRKLIGFDLVEIRDEAPAISVVKVKAEYAGDAGPVVGEITYRLVYEDPKGDFVVRGKPDGKWAFIIWGAID